jgi:sterol desaturase/sphingolipid hydroxylase (fatty acid hydroxylase superfamily)
MPYTNRNYGDTLSIWDRLFKTYAAPSPTNAVFGLDTHMDLSLNGISLVLLPYLKQYPILNAQAEAVRT